MVLPRFGFRATPVATTEDGVTNERRYRAEVERAFRAGDVALVQIQKAIDSMAVWKGNWTPGRTYPKNSMVLDGGWLMVSNKETDDRPAPQKIGSPSWLLAPFADPPPWVTKTATGVTRVLAGVRANVAANNSIIACRVWGSIGNSYRVVLIEDVNLPSGGAVNISEEVVADINGWITIEIPPQYVAEGKVYDALVVTRDAAAPTIDLTASWAYNRVNTTTPPSGNINHSNAGLIHVNAVDAGGTNRAAYLAGIGPGDQIIAQGITWAVSAASQAGSVFTFAAVPVTRITSNGTYSFLFKNFQPAAIEYVEITNGWTPYPNIQGIFSTTDYAGIVTNENVYGIDFLVQPIDLSPDWEIMSYASSL